MVLSIRKSVSITHILQVRHYATSGDYRRERQAQIDPHIKAGLPPWPKSKLPSPKELFDFDTLNDINFKNDIKNKYQKYVKIYHPDVSLKLEIKFEGKVLTKEELRQRFDQISSAYEILRDPVKRSAYWRYENSNWSQVHRNNARHKAATGGGTAYQLRATYERYRQASKTAGYGYQDDEAFWTAGSWEDYYRMKHKREPPTAEEIEKNKYKILAGVIAVATISTVLQYLRAVKKTEEFHAETAYLNKEANADLKGSRNNYEFGTGQLDRMERFLVLRRFNFFDRGDMDKHQDMKNEQDKIMRGLQAGVN